MNRSYPLKRLVFQIVVACLIAVQVISLPVSAASSAKQSFRKQNDILYWEKECADEGSGDSSQADVGDNGEWVYPTDKGRTTITSEFNENRGTYNHRGVDIGGDMGVPIYASRNGKVTNAEPAGGFGNWIVIQHEVDGKRIDTVYGHMTAASIKVKAGDTVTAGQQIAGIGSEGGSTGPHLHYEEWEGGRQGGKERKPEAVYGNSAEASGSDNTMASDSSGDGASCCPSSGGGGGGGGDCGSPLPSSIPEYWRNLIDNAAAKYPDTDRRAVAAVLWVENRGWPDPNKNWATSPASARGPFQFIPSSWASMGVDCNGDGKTDIDDPEDAVCAAFVHLKGSGCKPLMEGVTGDAEKDWNTVPFKSDGNNTVMSAIRHYNGSGAQDGVPLSQQPKTENGQYIQMAYWLIASDFTTSYNSETGQKGDATKSGEPDAAGTVTATNGVACSTDSDTSIPAADCESLVDEVKRLRAAGKFRSVNGEANLDKDLKNCTNEPIECGTGSGKGGVSPELLRAFVAVVKHIDSKGLGPVEFASMNTGHDCDGLMHPKGKAVDFWNCNSNPSGADPLCHEIFKYIYENAQELKVRQLIHNHKPPGTGCQSEGVFVCMEDHHNEVHMGL